MVINLRSAAGIVTIWVVAIAGVSATAWIAIDRAGRDITGASVSSLAPGPLATPTRVEPTEIESTPTPSDTPTPSVAPAPPAPPGTSWTSAPSATTAPAAPTSSATPSARAAHRRPATRPPAPTLTAQTRTTSATGGQVTVRCVGARISLQVAQPENEWRVNVVYPGSERILVTFTMGDEEEAHRTQVSAVCSRGIPKFDVTTR